MPNLMERAVNEINDLDPDIVICSGDLTTFGFKHEYAMARGYLDQIACDSLVVIPGNHDSRNVGYVHFEDMFGERNSVLRRGGVTVVAVDSTEPDLDHGQIGRGRYRWIEEQFADDADLKIFVLHHHLLPVPGTGRERNVVYDAGDCIECLQRAGVDLVLSGHKHVPYAWRLENLFVVNAGTVSSTRLQGQDAALLQRDRGHRAPRRRLAQVPVPRAGADHPVLDRDPRVREVHDADRGRGHGEDVRALAICDGEHYAPVVRDALAALPYEVVGLWLAGGGEKLRGGEDYGVPVVDSLEGAIAELEPEIVVDLSDEPVLGPRERLRVASRVLALGLPYAGPDFRFDPPALAPFPLPSLSIVGTGKRVGKTAVTGHVARLLALDRDVVVVAMGRGGPPEPEVAEVQPTLERLLELSRERPARRFRLPRDGRARRRRHDRLPSLRRRPRRRAGRVERARRRRAGRGARAGARDLRRQRRGDPAGRDGRARARHEHQAAARGRDRLPERLPDPGLRPRDRHRRARRGAGRGDPPGQGAAGRLGRAAAAAGRAGARQARRVLHDGAARGARGDRAAPARGARRRGRARLRQPRPPRGAARGPRARARGRGLPRRDQGGRDRRRRRGGARARGGGRVRRQRARPGRRARPRHRAVRLADQAIAHEAVAR